LIGAVSPEMLVGIDNETHRVAVAQDRGRLQISPLKRLAGRRIIAPWRTHGAHRQRPWQAKSNQIFSYSSASSDIPGRSPRNVTVRIEF
jgi:hypothetical protein